MSLLSPASRAAYASAQAKYDNASEPETEIDYESLSPAEQTRVDDRMCTLAAEEWDNLVSDRAKTFLSLQSTPTLYDLARDGIRYYSGTCSDVGAQHERMKREFVARFAGNYIDEAMAEALDRLRNQQQSADEGRDE